MTEPVSELLALAARAAALEDDGAMQARVRERLEQGFGPFEGLSLGGVSSTLIPTAGDGGASSTTAMTLGKALMTKAILGALVVGAVAGGTLVEVAHRLATPGPAAATDALAAATDGLEAATDGLATPTAVAKTPSAVDAPAAVPAEIPAATAPPATERSGLPPPSPPPPTTRREPERRMRDHARPARAESSSSAPSPTPADRPPPSNLDEERMLIERGKTALTRRDFSAVHAAVELHRRRHPTGAFAEERDALEVLALLQAGDLRSAAAADAFAARYPKSVFLRLMGAPSRAREEHR